MIYSFRAKGVWLKFGNGWRKNFIKFTKNLSMQVTNFMNWQLQIRKKIPLCTRETSTDKKFENIRDTKPSELKNKVEERLNKDLIFIGICENFSESLIMLYEKLGINKIKLWTPGLLSYKKLNFEEAPETVQELILSLCQEEMEFYRQQKNHLSRLISESSNQQVVSSYLLENKRSDLKFIQGVKQRLELASAVNGLDNLRLTEEISYFSCVNQHIEKIINDHKLLVK